MTNDDEGKFTVYAPPNELQRIEEVYLFVSVDESGEGLVAAPLLGPGSMVPLVAADKARLASLKPWARHIARVSGQKIKLIKFTGREIIEDITPDGGKGH